MNTNHSSGREITAKTIELENILEKESVMREIFSHDAWLVIEDTTSGPIAVNAFTTAELDEMNRQADLKAESERFTKLRGINLDLGSVPRETLITEKGLAEILGKCTASIKAAVKRGELPPARLMGKNTVDCWLILHRND